MREDVVIDPQSRAQYVADEDRTATGAYYVVGFEGDQWAKDSGDPARKLWRWENEPYVLHEEVYGRVFSTIDEAKGAKGSVWVEVRGRTASPVPVPAPVPLPNLYIGGGGDFDENTGLYRSTGTRFPPQTVGGQPVVITTPVQTVGGVPIQTAQPQASTVGSIFPLLLLAGAAWFLLKGD